MRLSITRRVLPLLLAAAAITPLAGAQRRSEVYTKPVVGSHASFQISVNPGSFSATSHDLPYAVNRRGNRNRGYGRGYGQRTRHWVPACTTYTVKRVWVPGHSHQVWVPPVYETRYDSCGRTYQVLVCAGYYRTVQDHGHWDERRVPVNNAGRWEYR